MDQEETVALTQTCEEYAKLVKSHVKAGQVYDEQSENLKALGAKIAAGMRKLNAQDGVGTLTVGKFTFTFQTGKGTWDIAKGYTKGDVIKAIEAEELGARLFSKALDAAKVRKFAESVGKDDDEGLAQLKRLHIRKSCVDWFTLAEGVNDCKTYGKPNNRLS